MQILATLPGRRFALGAALMAAAACGKQDAPPFVAPDPDAFFAETGTLRVFVLRDTANSRTVPKWVAFPGTRVNLYPEGDTIPIRQLNTTSTGEALFVGLAPGTYTYGTSLRTGTVVTITPGGTASATVVAGDTVLADTVKVRIPAFVSGFVGARYINQVREQTDRYSGVTVELLRETGVNTNVYTVIDTDVTDEVGAYSFIINNPGPERAQVRINSTLITQLTDPLLLFQGAGVPPYVRKLETITLPAINPDRSITQDFLFQYNSRITISPFRDTDEDGVRDDTPTPEGMLLGDTVFFQLRNETGERTILSGTSLRAVATSNGARPVVTINSLQAGTYTIYVDRIASRFPQTPFLYDATSFAPMTVVVEASSASPQPIDAVLFPIKAPPNP